jgi:hypothetical protein
LSGNNQHYIPKFILRGFRTSAPGYAGKVWVFRRGEPPSAKSIKKIAVDPYFYSKPSVDGSKTLDDEITRYENRLATLHTGLKALPSGGAADPKIVAEVISHLVVRNAHMRSASAHGLKRIVAGATNLFGDETAIRQLLGLDGEALSPRALQFFEDEVKKDARFAQLGLPLEVLNQMAFVLAKENYPNLVKNSLPLLRGALASLFTQSDDMARDAHNKALSKAIVPDQRVAVLSTLSWSVVIADTAAVLPDCVAFCIETTGDVHPLMMADSDKLSMVFMPLDPEKILVGKKDNPPSFDFRNFNILGAACSEDFFVSSQCTPEMTPLAGVIGERARTVIDQAVAESLQEFTPATQAPAPEVAQVDQIAVEAEQNNDVVAQAPISFQLHFPDSADEETANQIGAVVQAIVSAVAGLIPLGRLEGITFANDYEGALARLDRGFGSTTPLRPMDQKFGLSVAMAPIVRRDGLLKIHIVMIGGIGHALIGTDERNRDMALHMLIGQLAHAGCLELVEQALSGFSLSKIENWFEAQRYACVDPAWSGYLVSRVSAIFGEGAGPGYLELLLTALELAQKELPDARLDYRFHGDLTKLINISLEHISAILIFAAKLIGHYDGLEQSPLDLKGKLNAALEKLSLRAWFDVYQNDLRKFWDRRGEWESRDEFLSLASHVDRILWQFGMFPWRMPDGMFRIEAPLVWDAQRLPGAMVRQPLSVVVLVPRAVGRYIIGFGRKVMETIRSRRF